MLGIMAAYLPSGWPAGVHPPGSEGFEQTAITWLLDVVPPDYRLHGVLLRHPLALAALARHHVAACVAGARQGYRTARAELGHDLPPGGVAAVLDAYQSEGRRLVATAHAVDLVGRALHGEKFVPQLSGSRSTTPRPAQARPPHPRETAQRRAGPAPAGPRPPSPPHPRETAQRRAGPAPAGPRPASPAASDPSTAQTRRTEARRADPRSGGPRPAEPHPAAPTVPEPRRASPEPAVSRSAEAHATGPRTAEPPSDGRRTGPPRASRSPARAS
jgi:hypothetical protein